MSFNILKEKSFQSIDWSDFAGKESTLKAELDRREPFTTKFENSYDHLSIKKNIDTIQTLDDKSKGNVQSLLNNYSDISNNIQSYLSSQDYMHNNNSKYHYDDIMTPDSILKKESPDNITTVLEKDLNTLNLHQNSIYISSAIACATLLIAAIIIIPLQKNN